MKNIKKIFLSLFVIFAFFVGFVGCDNSTSSTTSSIAPTSNTTTSVAPSTSASTSAPTTSQVTSEVAEDKIVYAKIEAPWETVYVYVWDDNQSARASWPGELMEVENEELGIYKSLVEAKYTNIIFNNGSGGSGNQTADLKIYPNVNIYTVKSDISIEYGTYSNGTIDGEEVEVYVDTALYFVGESTGWGHNDPSKLVYNEAKDEATGTFTVYKDDTFKIANKGYSVQFGGNAANLTLCDGLEDDGSEYHNIKCTKSGKYSFKVTNVSTAEIACVVTFVEAVEDKEEQDPSEIVYRTIYLDLGEEWEKVYAYGWNDDSNINNGSWPGVEMTHVTGDIYSIEINELFTHIIFNNNSGSQTSDLELKANSNAFILETKDNVTHGVYIANGDSVIEAE